MNYIIITNYYKLFKEVQIPPPQHSNMHFVLLMSDPNIASTGEQKLISSLARIMVEPQVVFA